MSDHTIAGLHFNARGVVVPDDQIQRTWARAVAAEHEVAALQVALHKMLARIQELEDETMGAALAARFDTPPTDTNT